MTAITAASSKASRWRRRTALATAVRKVAASSPQPTVPVPASASIQVPWMVEVSARPRLARTSKRVPVSSPLPTSGDSRHSGRAASHQLIRLFKPIAANKTLVESWTFRLVDAPDMLLERTLVYNRLINAPTSVVGHDDLEVYERAQEGLKVDANQWVNVGRLYDPEEGVDVTAETNGTTEWQMRNQFRAWSKYMTLSM